MTIRHLLEMRMMAGTASRSKLRNGRRDGLKDGHSIWKRPCCLSRDCRASRIWEEGQELRRCQHPEMSEVAEVVNWGNLDAEARVM